MFKEITCLLFQVFFGDYTTQPCENYKMFCMVNIRPYMPYMDSMGLVQDPPYHPRKNVYFYGFP